MKRLLALLASLSFCLLLTVNALAADLPTDSSNDVNPSADSADELSPSEYLSQLIDDGRHTYTESKRPTKPTLNSLTNSNIIGDERQFVILAGVDPEGDVQHFDNPPAQTYQTYEKMTPTTLRPYGIYRVLIYYHNNCMPSTQDSNASINGAHVKVDFPRSITPDEADSVILATISADNSSPSSVSSLVRITADYDLNLRVVNGSAIIHSGGQADGTSLPNDLFADGVKVGYNYLNGVVPGNNFGYVSFIFEAIPVDPDTVSESDIYRYADLAAANQPTSASELRVLFGLTVGEMIAISSTILAATLALCLYLYVRNRIRPDPEDEE